MNYKILLNAIALFNHSNVRLPVWFDRMLRLVWVTPDTHLVLCSTENHETNSSFGFCLSWWVFLLRTYDAQPEAGPDSRTVDRPEFRDLRVEWLPFMLLLPVRRQ